MRGDKPGPEPNSGPSTKESARPVSNSVAGEAVSLLLSSPGSSIRAAPSDLRRKSCDALPRGMSLGGRPVASPGGLTPPGAGADGGGDRCDAAMVRLVVALPQRPS